MGLGVLFNRARALFDPLFVDTVTITHKTGETVNEIGTRVEQWGTTYSGVGLVQTTTTTRDDTLKTGIPVHVTSLVCKIPAHITIPAGRVRVTVNETSDTGLQGETFEVVNVTRDSIAMVKRLELSMTVPRETLRADS